jgi:DNA ligase-associated metallophosphoesterase
MISHSVLKQTFKLLPQKAIFWEEKQILIISDVHLGKSHHFRKSGVAVPKFSDYENLQIIANLVTSWKPKQIIFLGDLFHSQANNYFLDVIAFMQGIRDIQFDLVIGNHDIVHASWYSALSLKIHPSFLEIKDFIFTHEPLLVAEIPESKINICGHIHPCVQLRGKARQSAILPCFYFSKRQVVLPAFGKFTGNFKIKPQKDDQIFVLVNDVVMAI